MGTDDDLKTSYRKKYIQFRQQNFYVQWANVLLGVKHVCDPKTAISITLSKHGE